MMDIMARGKMQQSLTVKLNVSEARVMEETGLGLCLYGAAASLFPKP
jgi:hypothetical protein